MSVVHLSAVVPFSRLHGAGFRRAMIASWAVAVENGRKFFLTAAKSANAAAS